MTAKKLRIRKAPPKQRRTKTSEPLSSGPIKANPVAKVAPKKPIIYPNWAPRHLCNFHKCCVERPGWIIDLAWWPGTVVDERKAVATLGALILDSRMEPVWKALQKRSENLDEDRIELALDRRDWALAFVQFCLRTMEIYRATPKLTTSEKKARLAKIVKAARDVEAALKHAPSWGLRDIRVDDLLEGYGIGTPTLPIPLLREIMPRLAERAEAETRTPSVFPKAKAKAAHSHFFIRKLSGYFRRTYGSPLYEHVAVVTAVALSRDDVNPEAVRALVTGTTRRKTHRATGK